MPQYKQVWKSGFPPREIHSPAIPAGSHLPISTFLQNRERIVLEVATPAQLASAAAAGIAKASAPEASSVPDASPSHEPESAGVPRALASRASVRLTRGLLPPTAFAAARDCGAAPEPVTLHACYLFETPSVWNLTEG